MRLVALPLLLAAVLAPAQAAAAPPAGLVNHGVVFARHGAGTLRMDVHHPASRPPSGAPVIVWIHGGGFHSGDRARMTPYARFFARRGYVTATIDYRLRPRAEVQAIGYAAASGLAQADAEAAVRHLRRNAGALGIDRGRIAAAGVSAGAITALNVAARATGAARVQAAVGISGFGPVTDLDASAPPLLLLHGTADRTVPFDRSVDTCRAAKRAGAQCDLVPFPGAGHRLAADQRREAAARIARWLRARTGMSPA